MIRIENASFGYEKKEKIIENLSLHIKEGESVGLIGANGTGKSTFLKMLTGLVGHEGSIKICGIEVEKKNLAQIRKDLGFVFQDSDNQLFMPTVYDDIAFAPRNYGMSKEDVEASVDEALERIGITDLKYKENYKMSGGEKRMAAIATILAMKPRIIMMDEPSITLDPYNRRRLIHVLNDMPETKLIASHDLDMILDACNRVILMKDGKIYMDGLAEEVLTNQKLLEECHLELPFCMQKR